MIKVTQRVPLEQYAYIEFEDEYDSIEDAITENRRLISLHADPGLPRNEWAKVRNRLYATGECDPELKLSRLQAHVVNEFKKAQRSVSADEPVIN